ncbi:MAG: hypothetical protein ACXVPB_14755, partial [Bacteroidia bacterium]
MKKRFYIILILVAVFNQLGVAVNLPTSGAATANSCGTAVTVYDNGGSASNYSNSVSGYIVLNCSGLATINISGTYATESGWDYVNIYDGSGTGGTLLSQYTGNGSINYTGKCGQTLTIQLTSDGSTTASGIALNVTYSGSCTAYSSLNIPASGNNSVSCGTNTLLYLNNGSGNYSNSD